MSQTKRKIFTLLGLIVAAVSASSARAAMTTLKQVQVSNGSQIDLLFDGKVGKSQARTEFFNDVIQVSLTDVSVYPAKISSVNGGPLVKIFAYQYAPKLVRCRLTVSGKAEDYKDKLQISSNGKVLSLRLSDGAVKTDQIAVQAAHPSRAPVKETAEKAESPKATAEKPREIEAAKADAGQAALLEKVMKSAAPSKPVAVAVVEARENDSVDKKPEKKFESKKLALGGGKSLPSPMGVLGKLLAVIGVFGAMALVAKKYFHGRSGGDRQLNARIARGAVSEQGWMSALGGFARTAAAGIGRKDKMIEVLSNHHLGPKKSIAVVRVMGRTLVLGVTNESINLISQIAQSSEDETETDVDLEGLFAQAARTETAPAAMISKAPAPKMASRPLPGISAGGGPSAFSAMVQQEAKKPVAPSSPSVRNQIRNRLEGLKQL